MRKTSSEPSPSHDVRNVPENPQIAFSYVDKLQLQDSRLSWIPISKKRTDRSTPDLNPMAGFVPTPPEIVDRMVERLFRGRLPTASDILLDPGCGTGAFLSGVLRWCLQHGAPTPKLVGIESDNYRAKVARDKLDATRKVEIRSADFLSDRRELFDFIIGNPPYVAIYGLSEGEKREYRAKYETARGRFDLYLLFFERALRSLKPGGRMVFITPEKFLYVETAAPMRQLLGRVDVEEIELVDEQTFAGLVTYPTITTIVNRSPRKLTSVRLRDGTYRRCSLKGTASWMPIIRGAVNRGTQSPTLQEICVRLSCGVATGADDVFVRELDSLHPELIKFAHPAIAGRELTRSVQIPRPRSIILIPYHNDGALLLERELGPLLRYLLSKQHRLLQRTCVTRKPWYAFHETPLLSELLRPKILCKDITQRPYFWKDTEGLLVPRHSVYYIVPRNAGDLEKLCSYLNSPSASDWLAAHCQRVANGFLRLQSNVLKMMPIPDELTHAQKRDSALKKGSQLSLARNSENIAM